MEVVGATESDIILATLGQSEDPIGLSGMESEILHDAGSLSTKA